MTDKVSNGSVQWVDLTVDQPEDVRDFYREVAGWSVGDVNMGEYSDFNMLASDGQPAAGICHARGPNVDLPPVWLIYILVDDLDDRLARCTCLGGQIVCGPKEFGNGSRYGVIRDPAGAHVALLESGTPSTDV